MGIALVLALAVAAPEERRLAAVPEGVRLAHRPSFDAEGKSVVWSGVVDDQMWFYVGDERRAGPFDCVCSPSVSARGGRVAFAGIREGRRYAYVDGREGSPWDYVVIPVVVSADGSAVAYSTGFQIVLGDAAQGPFEAVTPPALSANGRGLAFGKRSAGRWSLVLGGKEHPVDRDLERVFVSADGARVGGVVSRERKLGVVVDGRIHGHYDQMDTPVFSPDGRRWATAARDGASWFIVTGDAQYGPYGDAGAPAFSADGGRLSFGVRVGRDLRWVSVPLP